MIIASVWVPSHAEREAIANGHNVRLLVWGRSTPPVHMEVTDERLTEWPHEND